MESQALQCKVLSSVQNVLELHDHVQGKLGEKSKAVLPCEGSTERTWSEISYDPQTLLEKAPGVTMHLVIINLDRISHRSLQEDEVRSGSVTRPREW